MAHKQVRHQNEKKSEKIDLWDEEEEGEEGLRSYRCEQRGRRRVSED